MATVTGLTAERMLAIEGASVIDGDVVGDNLILTQHNGTQINAGNVRGPVGPTGPVGQDLATLLAKPVLDIGLVGQIRAGRQLTATDFTNMGLSAPVGLWNLSDLTDASGNGRNLLNKRAVPFDVGINGLAATSAKFVGLTGAASQALYIADTGAADPFRLKSGSIGFWIKPGRRGTTQHVLGKDDHGLTSRSYEVYIAANNTISSTFFIDPATTTYGVASLTDVCDDRWHFVVFTVDGIVCRCYVDSILEGEVQGKGLLNPSSGPLTLGGLGADGANDVINPLTARLDEVFITNDVLSEDQIRNLYCSKIPHTLAVVPSRVSLNVRRRRRGATLVVADFSAQPLRLHNFSAGSLGDEGSANVALVNGAAAVSVAGVDGSLGNAFNFNGAQALTSTDAGLPVGLGSRSFGLWFKTLATGTLNIMAWGQTPGTNDERIYVSAGQIVNNMGADGLIGPIANDGAWHHVVITEDNGAADGIKRRMYFDGRYVVGSTGMVATVLGGANFFRIGANSTGGAPFVGQIDGAFVTNYTMGVEEVLRLYLKGSLALNPSPKNVGDHVEALSATDILVTFDTLDGAYQVDLGVAA